MNLNHATSASTPRSSSLSLCPSSRDQSQLGGCHVLVQSPRPTHEPSSRLSLFPLLPQPGAVSAVLAQTYPSRLQGPALRLRMEKILQELVLGATPLSSNYRGFLSDLTTASSHGWHHSWCYWIFALCPEHGLPQCSCSGRGHGLCCGQSTVHPCRT